MTVLAGAQVPASAPKPASPEVSKSDVLLLPTPAADPKTTGKIPVNLARSYLGAKISIQKPDGKLSPTDIGANGLLHDDTSFRYGLGSGKTTLIVSLPQNLTTNRLCLIKENAAGTVQVYGSSALTAANSQSWQPLSGAVALMDNFPTNINWSSADVRYVKIEFDLKTGGQLGPLGLFGVPTVKDVNVVEDTRRPTDNPAQPASATMRPRNTPVTDQVNVASVVARGRVAYVTSGLEQSQSPVTMIDNDVATAYTFDSTDSSPALLVELPEDRPVRRISSYYDASPGAWDLYLLNHVPGNEAAKPATPTAQGMSGGPMIATSRGLGSWLTSVLLGQASPQILHLPASFFQNTRVSLRLTAKPGEPYGMVEVNPKKVKFILFHWVPETPGGKPVRVFQICVFTDPREQRWDALPIGDYASLGDPDLGGAHGLEGQPPLVNNPTLPADPPRIPVISP